MPYPSLLDSVCSSFRVGSLRAVDVLLAPVAIKYFFRSSRAERGAGPCPPRSPYLKQIFLLDERKKCSARNRSPASWGFRVYCSVILCHCIQQESKNFTNLDVVTKTTNAHKCIEESYIVNIVFLNIILNSVRQHNHFITQGFYIGYMFRL